MTFGVSDAASAASKPKVQQINVIIGFAQANVNEIPLWYGLQSGTFAKYGLNVKLVSLSTSPNVSLAISSGSITIGFESSIGVMQSYNAGEPIEGISVENQGSAQAIVVSNTYMASHGLTAKSTAAETAKALIGSTQASGSSTTTGQALEILRYYGVQASQYKVVNVASAAAALVALKSGQADWDFAGYPTPLQAEQQGFGTVLITPQNTPALQGHQYNIIVSANTAFASGHPELMKKIVRAIHVAVTYVKGHELQVVPLAQSFLPGYTRAQMRKTISEADWSSSPLMTEGLWRQALAYNIKTGQILAGSTKIQENGIWTNKYA